MPVSSSGCCANFACAVSRLIDKKDRQAAQIIYLGPGETPPNHLPWLIVVKTYGLDFELIATASRYFTPVTLGSDATLEAALERAAQAARRFRIETVYVTGVAKR